MDQIIFHIDVNSAFLSWTAVSELNKGNPLDIRTVPAIIGGDKDKRHGIVLARSIPAKKYGIVTAEPVGSALKKCPTLEIYPPDFSIYSKMSHALMDYLHTFTDDIEQASIDECYLNYTPIAHFYSSYMEFAEKLHNEIYENFGFTVNIGISDKKVLAKMASDFTKPHKIHTLFSNEIVTKMWPLPVGDLFLCGKSAAQTLNKLGINTIGDLANADLNILTDNLKSHGKTLWDFANGRDDSKVEKVYPGAKGIGNSVTSEHDVLDRDEAFVILNDLCESVSRRLKRAEFLCTSVTVEIKYTTFKSFSRQCQTETPIETTKSLHDYSKKLFDELWDGTPIRLLGVRATKLVSYDEPVQLSLFSEDFLGKENPAEQTIQQDTKKQIALDDALRNIRSKYGQDIIKKGRI